MKLLVMLFSVAWLLTGGVVAVRAQSALDGFGPNANGSVPAVVVQPDGKILIGGSFTTLSPNGIAVTRNSIARLNPDGTLDAAFDPNANSLVNTIALQSDGKILVGGTFTNIAGATRNHIARLNADGTLDVTFNPDANNSVFSIAVQSDGKILAGGNFTNIVGTTRNRIARLNADGTLDTSFNLDANGIVRVIAVQADGKILVGGDFNGTNSIGGATRNRIARLDATTGLADAFNPNASGAVYAFAAQPDGKILVGGAFSGASSIGGQTRNYIARLDATTGLADAFNPNANGFGVYSIVVQPDGRILVGGDFGSIGGQARGRIARLDATTGLADSLDPNATADFFPSVNAIVVQADGKILIGGNFNRLTPNGASGAESVTLFNIARLETDGRADRTLDINMVGDYVLATAIQPDGKILIAGGFTSIQGVARNSIARLNPDGRLDAAFNPNANNEVFSIALQADGKALVSGFFTGIGVNGRSRIARLDATTGAADSFHTSPSSSSIIYTVAVQADGKILVGGVFTSIGGQLRTNIARLDATTGLADSFAPNASGTVYSIAVQPDGKILAGGDFTSIGGQTRNRIARLDATTGAADSFDPNSTGIVYAIAVQADGKVLAGGDFSGANSIGGQPRNHIARLDATTGLADSFNPNANSRVFSFALQSDGKILVGGLFTSLGGQPRSRVARIDPITGLADSFNPNANINVFSIALEADGKILVGGNFSSIGGQTRSGFARLSNDTAALQNLAVSQSTITWTRGGSSPQFARVIFESSTDNLNFIPLGNGAPTDTNWTLTGLSLPLGQNIYIRARGFYTGGDQNGSGSITEYVRNAFLSPLIAPPLLLNLQLSANTEIVLSWPTNFAGFTLVATTNLNTNVWSVVSPAPAISGTNNVVTNTTTEGQKFYRLVKP